MGIDECIDELKMALTELYDTSIEKQKKRIPAGTSKFMSLEFYTVFGNLVNDKAERGKRDMVDERVDLCRT